MKPMILLVALCALVGCEQPDSTSTPQPKRYGAMHIQVWHDDSRGVTCWLYGGTNGGISCLPDGVLIP